MITNINEFRKNNESASKPKYTIDELKDMFKKVIDDKDITTRTQGEKLVLVNINGDRMVITTDGVVQDTAFGSASNIIKSNKLKVESVHNTNTNIESINEDESNPNYMVLGNISKMSRMLAEMANLLSTEGLDEWAKDHIATSADDIEEVYNYLKSKNESINLPGINGEPAICWEPVKEAAARDHYIIVVGDDVKDNGNKESMNKVYESIPKGTRPSNYRSMYKLVKEDK